MAGGYLGIRITGGIFHVPSMIDGGFPSDTGFFLILAILIRIET